MQKSFENMSVVQLVAISTPLLSGKTIVEAKEIVGSEKNYRYIIIKDKDNLNYLITTPKKEKYINKFIADIQNTTLLKDKYIVPEIISHNDKIAIYQTYTGASYDITIINNNQIKALAKALAKLHTINYQIVEQNKIPAWTNEQLVKNLFDVLDEVRTIGEIPNSIITRFENSLENSAIWKYDSAIINGSIEDKCIIFNEEKVIKILNWSALQYSDPAIDLSAILPKITKEKKQHFLKEYNKEKKKYNQHLSPDIYIDERAEFYADFKLISEYLIAKADKNIEEEKKALKKIKQLEKQNKINDELNKVEEINKNKEEKRQIQELENKINDAQKTELLDITAAELGKLRQTTKEENKEQTTTQNQTADSEVEKELLQMLNNDSGEINLRNQPSINSRDNNTVVKKEFSLSEHTSEIKE